jgi:metal-sulfur cluster biosynthetic enzyme
MPAQVQRAVEGVEGVDTVSVELVWDPPWSSEKMSEDARVTLEMMGISWTDPAQGPRFTDLTFGRTKRP